MSIEVSCRDRAHFRFLDLALSTVACRDEMYLVHAVLKAFIHFRRLADRTDAPRHAAVRQSQLANVPLAGLLVSILSVVPQLLALALVAVLRAKR